jgi:hypothetical protein
MPFESFLQVKTPAAKLRAAMHKRRDLSRLGGNKFAVNIHPTRGEEKSSAKKNRVGP